MLRFAPEGYPFISGFLLISIVTLFFTNPWIIVIPLGFTVFMAFFFRDPERVIPQGKGIFVSPADGRIILIKEVREEEYLKGNAIEISIFMSLFDVHINRAPCDGTVMAVKHTPGRFLPAYRKDSSVVNENITMLIEGEQGRVVVRQVAGILARRAHCRVKVGDTLKQGQRYGLIKFGSRLDIYLPLDTKIKVKLGDNVKAGETVIGVMHNE